MTAPTMSRVAAPAGVDHLPDARLTVEWRLFAAATAIGTLHALDDALLNRQPGVPVDQHAGALAVTLAVVPAALLAFRRVGPGIRAGTAVTLGSLALANGAMHVVHVAANGVGGSDASGVAVAVAGLVLLGLGVLIPFVHRGEGDRSRRRRWVNRILASTTTVLVAVTVVVPLAVAIGQTHMPRDSIGAPPHGRYAEVTFQSSDGLRLSGWYTPSSNRAAVVVVAGAGGDRLGSVQHANLMARHGYGVLLYDARGTGESEGNPNGYGWGWRHDVRGAMTFLQHQPDVDPQRIGGIGLSRGADVLIEVAAKDRDLRAVVGDGATGRSLGDVPLGGLVHLPSFWTHFLGVRVLSGTSPGEPLQDLVPQVSPTPLMLIATGSLPPEQPYNEAYARVAREPFELWNLPELSHVGAIREVADEYEDRVVGHFNKALLDAVGATSGEQPR